MTDMRDHGTDAATGDAPAHPQEAASGRRSILVAGGLAALAAASPGRAQDSAPAGAQAGAQGLGPVPQPPADRMAGPIKAGRGSNLTGRVAVITGAARGIGRAIAVEYAANGADVVALDIAGPISSSADAPPATRGELDETIRQVRAYGRVGTAYQADIRNIAQLRQIADSVERQHGKIDILVANAAIQAWQPLLHMADSDWDDTIDNNLNGTARTLRAFAPKMVGRKYGRIIVISSMQGRQGTKGAAAYSASKWGLIGLAKSAALEFGEFGITVNTLIPGLVATPLTLNAPRLQAVMLQTTHQTVARPSAEAAFAARGKGEALQVGWLQTSDISPMAVFLASDAAAMITGAEFEVTGGDSALNA